MLVFHFSSYALNQRCQTLFLPGGPVSWHFILPVRFSYLGLLRMRATILHPFSFAEQQYLMYLHYCKGGFMVGVGLDVKKTQSNR